MSTTRTTRVGRADRKKVWTPPNMLDAPPAPEGYKYRFVRASLRGEAQEANVYSRMRQGYEPVMLEELPEEHRQLDYVEGGRHQGVVRSGDLILMKAPEEVVEQRNAHYEMQAKRMMEAVDAELKGAGNPVMPIFNERRSTVIHGNKSVPTSVTVVEDEE